MDQGLQGLQRTHAAAGNLASGNTDAGFTDMNVKLASGQIVYALLEARGAYAPGNAEVFTLTAEALQD